jgi:serpin B
MLTPAQTQAGAVTMPRFKFAREASLAQSLQSLGMTDAFVPGVADLSGIDGTTDLYVSDVIHQADIAVDEQGTTAAAATAVVGDKVAIITNYPALTVDRPFLFFIVHQPTGALLFAGRVVDPSTAS